MTVAKALTVLLFSLILSTEALEQWSPHARRSKRDPMASMVSFFSSVDKRLAALEASRDNSTEERVVEMEGKMQERLQDMEEKLQGMQDGMQRLESIVNVLAEKVANMVEAKANATEESATSLEATKTESQSSSVTCQYKYQYQFEKESSRSSGEQQCMEKLEAELTRLQEKMSALDKRLQDNDHSVGTLHNASVLAIEGVVHSVTELVAASEQNLKSTMEYTVRFFYEGTASMMNEAKAQLFARAVNDTAALNASIARMEQTTKELVTRMSAVEGKEHSLTELIAAFEHVTSTMQNATEILASMMSESEANLLANQETSVALLNSSIARVEQTTKKLATHVSALEAKLDNATSLQVEEIGKTRTRCEDIQKRITDLRNHTTEVNDPVRYMRSCQWYYEEGQRTSGVYRLQLQDGQGPMEVFCDMSKGAGWVVFQRRQDGSVDFFRNWTSYEDGFGELLHEFWLGNRNIHRLASAGLTQLRVDLQAWNGSTAFAIYSHFSVGNASSSYRLSVSGYSGTAGDSLGDNSGRKFSTFDRDEDISDGNCAQGRKGAWWYDRCANSNLNGEYGIRGSSGLHHVWWYHWLGVQSLQHTELKLK